MAIPRVQLPTLRAFLGAIALKISTSTTANRALKKLEGGLTQNDVDVRTVVNAAIDSLDTVPSMSAPGPIGATTPSTGRFTAITLTGAGTTIGWDPTANVLMGQTAKTATAASQAGNDAAWIVQYATAGTSTPGAAQGGNFKVFAGNAARLTSGDANGGGYFFRIGAGVGAGTAGNFTIEQSDESVLVRVDYFGGIAIGSTAIGNDGFVGLYVENNTTDAACKGLILKSQEPWASATGTNRNPGNVVVDVPPPAAGGTAGKVSFKVSNTERATVTSGGIEYNGSIRGVDGGVPNLGRSAVVMPADANHTLTAAQMANHVLTVTSGVALTATRDVVAPLVDGAIYRAKNLTTGGQSIRIIGATGTGATIANGATATAVCDGTNWDTY